KLFLNNALSIRSPPDDCPPIPILYSPRYNFASRGRAFINKNDQLTRCKISALRTIGVIFMSLFMRSFRIDNKPSFSKKFTSHLDRHVEIPTSIISHLNIHFLCSMFFQRYNRLSKLIGRINSKSSYLTVSHTRFNHISNVQGAYRYLITHPFDRGTHYLSN